MTYTVTLRILGGHPQHNLTREDAIILYNPGLDFEIDGDMVTIEQPAPNNSVACKRSVKALKAAGFTAVVDGNCYE